MPQRNEVSPAKIRAAILDVKENSVLAASGIVSHFGVTPEEAYAALEAARAEGLLVRLFRREGGARWYPEMSELVEAEAAAEELHPASIEVGFQRTAALQHR
jgi:hypothetical protein